jgi:uncharacterized protein (UPF0297 family)
MDWYVQNTENLKSVTLVKFYCQNKTTKQKKSSMIQVYRTLKKAGYISTYQMFGTKAKENHPYIDTTYKIDFSIVHMYINISFHSSQCKQLHFYPQHIYLLPSFEAHGYLQFNTGCLL